MPDVLANVRRLCDRIKQVCRRVGRDPSEIRIVCVTKEATPAAVREAMAAGLTEFGENRVQEAKEKIAEIGRTGVQWHFIGRLQRNKAKLAVELFDMVQSVDRVELAEELERHAAAAEKRLPVLIQVNASGEASKFGCAPGEAIELVRAVARFPHLQIQGLMTIAPLVDDPELARPTFRGLRELRDVIQREEIANVSLETLSMGMTNDFEVAIEEGSTMIRVGRAIF